MEVQENSQDNAEALDESLAKMTGILQPLDVAVNRSFQQHYNDSYTVYLTAAINSNDPADRTRTGNVKMPSYEKVSEWVLEWRASQTVEGIAKAFTVCGLTPNFSLQSLHKPLRECFDDDFSVATWIDENEALANNADPNNPDAPADGSYIIFNEDYSLFKAVYERMNVDEDYEFWLKETKDSVRNYIVSDDILSSLFTDQERSLFDSGKPTDTQIEVFAIAHALEIQLEVTTIDVDFNVIDRDEYNVVEGGANVKLVMFEKNFGVVEEI